MIGRRHMFPDQGPLLVMEPLTNGSRSQAEHQLLGLCMRLKTSLLFGSNHQALSAKLVSPAGDASCLHKETVVTSFFHHNLMHL